MFKLINRIKQKMNTKQINNERGSVLITALAVVFVLSFSVTAITQLSINTANQTTLKIDDVGDENVGKVKINQAIAEFRDYIALTDGDYTAYNNTEKPAAEVTYGLTITDESENIAGFGTSHPDYPGVTATAYKFAYTLLDGNTLYKFCYTSNKGQVIVTYNPFDYELGTTGQLILNGGWYDGINIFGQDIYMANQAPYVVDGGTSQATTSALSSQYPTLTPTTASTMYFNVDYKYCSGSCFTTNASANPFVFNESNYVDVEGSALADQGTISDNKMNNFFGTFDYDEYFVEIVRDEAPRNAQLITDPITFATVETVVLANSDMLAIKKQGQQWIANWGAVDYTQDFINVTNVYDYNPALIDFATDFKQSGNKKVSLVYDGDITIDSNIKVQTDCSLVVFGDLTIDSVGLQNVEGTIIVTGDVYITGGTKDFEGSLIVLGQTYINFDLGEGVKTSGNNYGFTLMAKDNIWLMEHYESHTGSGVTTEISAFIYTEESLYFDGVNSRWNMSGSIYARGLGVSGNEIFMEDQSAVPVRGIIINSYKGYINGSGVEVPGATDESNGFRVTKVTNGSYQDRFDNIPTFDSVSTQIGEIVFYDDEFIIE